MPKITLVLPLDASQVPDFKPERGLKVAVVGAKDVLLASTPVKLNEKGLAEAKLELEKPEGDLRLIVGPDDADDKEILGLQTLSVRVSPNQITQPTVKLPPLKITPYYWNFWLRWCRWFSVRGRVVCADGSPVPGAKVCAYDIDSFWIWSGHQLVGCDTTDATGSFAFRFRWCCGWWPWWWWQLRDWRLDHDLWVRIRKGLELDPRIPIPPRPTMKPSLDVFDHILGGDHPPVTRAQASAVSPLRPAIDTSQLAALREKLLVKLPKVPDLQNLQIWPWIPHEPWFDCQPDIAFRVTQQCDGTERVIVNEPWWRTRWNVDTNLDVTLTANASACCIRDDELPPGNCVVLSSVCGVNVSNIGGNIAAPAAPVGYVRPGVNSIYGDTPFAETLVIEGQFGSAVTADYYEFEVAPTAAGPWTPVDIASAGGFSRQYWDGLTFTMPYANFPFDTIDGRRVIETRRHYEATHPGPWGINWLWTGHNYDTLMAWHTLGHYDNGQYHLRLVAWDRSGDQLVNRRELPLCTNDPSPPVNHLVVRLDSRTTDDEPMCKIVDVKVNGVTAGPCSIQQVPQGASMTVDFIAGDIDSHLSFYSLIATFGVDESVNLLSAPGGVLSGVMLEGVPAAVQVGPSYPQALAQGAVSPHWAGGGLRLHIPDLRQVITRSCCYQIELRVYKRAIVNCSDTLPYRDFTFYSVTFTV